jgi:hypothetical protein
MTTEALSRPNTPGHQFDDNLGAPRTGDDEASPSLSALDGAVPVHSRLPQGLLTRSA